ncbi:hypothetical protein BOX15_Mlig018317g1 [Macrostomum lignano]|uniref:PDZ domain-containing protein n=1 Tax=Macrostomum lignano TaxID=282301 RepID=A0A267EQ48_9PLAT|nr:hypothetical protein BOX15_Mlig018317g1 [Macrostomum lignano]
MSRQVRMTRPDSGTPWGFRLQGGRDFNSALTIQKVSKGGMAERHGVCVGDRVVSIGGTRHTIGHTSRPSRRSSDAATSSTLAWRAAAADSTTPTSSLSRNSTSSNRPRLLTARQPARLPATLAAPHGCPPRTRRLLLHRRTITHPLRSITSLSLTLYSITLRRHSSSRHSSSRHSSSRHSSSHRRSSSRRGTFLRLLNHRRRHLRLHVQLLL